MLGTEFFFWKRTSEKFSQCYASLIKERSECMNLGRSWAKLAGKEKLEGWQISQGGEQVLVRSSRMQESRKKSNSEKGKECRGRKP